MLNASQLLKVLAVSVMLFVGCRSLDARRTSDSDLARRLVGTWVSDVSEPRPFRNKAVYRPNGTGTEILWRSDRQETSAMRVETRWTITNGLPGITSVQSSDVRRVPVGLVLRDRLVSISADQLIFEPVGGYEGSPPPRETRLREK